MQQEYFPLATDNSECSRTHSSIKREAFLRPKYALHSSGCVCVPYNRTMYVVKGNAIFALPLEQEECSILNWYCVHICLLKISFNFNRLAGAEAADKRRRKKNENCAQQ